ncbi:MAG: hypothetical protein P1Q69_11275 [Candidatus Thorarchaeota archaeon]|nr:hypothetical protein [Candidatus Thorarchaeota archaeon]
MNEQSDDAMVRYISLVRKTGGEPIIGIPYREMSVDPDLIASFVLAIIIFENRQLKTFTKEGYVVVIEEGRHVVGLLIVDKVGDDEPYRVELRKIIENFENEYDAQLTNWKGDIRPFRDFALSILGSFPYRELDGELVPHILSPSEAAPDRNQNIPWSVGETDAKIQTVVGFINGKRTINEIITSTDFPEREGVAIFSMLDRYKWIRLEKKLGPTSYLRKLSDPPMYLIGAYGDQLTEIVGNFDGIKNLTEVCEALSYTIEVVTTIARTLIDAGVLGYVESN